MDFEGRYEPPADEVDAEDAFDLEESARAGRKRRRRPSPGKVTRTLELNALPSIVRNLGSERARESHPIAPAPPPIQADGGRIAAMDPFAVHVIASEGVAGNGSTLPHLAAIQRAFGHHDVTGVRAHVGGAAADAAGEIGAQAYATGDDVAFAATPDLRQAAHEAAHIVQQRGGVRLDGGVGVTGDVYEQHADAVADLVVRGQSAEALLDTMAHRGPGGGPAVQRQDGARRGRRGARAPNPALRGLTGIRMGTLVEDSLGLWHVDMTAEPAGPPPSPYAGLVVQERFGPPEIARGAILDSDLRQTGDGPHTVAELLTRTSPGPEGRFTIDELGQFRDLHHGVGMSVDWFTNEALASGRLAWSFVQTYYCEGEEVGRFRVGTRFGQFGLERTKAPEAAARRRSGGGDGARDHGGRGGGRSSTVDGKGGIEAVDRDAAFEAAARGVAGGGAALPHAERIQAAFGKHDVRGVRAHVGGEAAAAAAELRTRAYATGEDVAFAGTPDLHLAAHEAAHVIQQRAGVRVEGGLGRSGDAYERHADAVADAVVRGESAEALLDTMGASNAAAGAVAVQREDRDGDGIDDDAAGGTWATFAPLFLGEFAPVIHVFGERPPDAARLQALFTDEQREKLTSFIQSTPHRIPSRLFNGVVRPELTTPMRVMMAAHILSTGEHSPGSTEETERVQARMCGHWAQLCEAYAGASGTAGHAGTGELFDHEGNVVLGGGSGGLSYPFGSHRAREGEAGTGNAVVNMATLPFSRFGEIQAGDWLYIYNDRSGGAGNHSVIFSNWVTGEDEGREPRRFRQAVTYDQLHNGTGEGGARHTIRLGEQYQDSPKIQPITRIERPPADARPAQTVEELLSDIVEPGADTGEPARGTLLARNVQWLRGRRVELADAKSYVRAQNTRLIGAIDARLDDSQRALLRSANERDHLETLIRLNERLYELSLGSAALDRSDGMRDRRIATTGHDTAHGSATQAQYQGTRAQRGTTGAIASVQEPLTARSVAASAAPVADGASAAPVQPRGELRGDDVAGVAARGVSGAASTLPFADQIQAAFGAHDVSGIRAHVGGAAAEAAGELGAQAYATGSAVAFATTPDLRLAAHEAAHVVQQRAGVALAGGVGRSGDAYEQHADAVADAVVRGESAAPLLDAGPGAALGIGELGRALGHDFRDVDVRVGDAHGSGHGAYATVEGGRDVIAFDETSPSREQVAHELVHVAQRRRFGEGSGGVATRDAAPEVEARELAPRVAAGEAVEVHAAPAGRVHRDDTVAQSIHEKLHGWITDDEAGALEDLQGDTDRPATISAYRRLFGYSIWGDFQDNASGDILHRALALLWPHMTLMQRLETQTGIDDDEQGIMQTIRNASAAEVALARPNIQPYLDELEPADQYQMRKIVYPDQPVDNVAWLLSAGRGWVWDDEGPVATAILDLTPRQRVQLWNERHHLVEAMFSTADAQQIRRMCITDDGAMATETDALRVRMELATEGAGTDEEGVTAAIAGAGARRDERAQILHALETGTNLDGTPLTAEQRRELEARRDAIGDVEGELLTATHERGGEGALDDDSFLGRVAGDMDAGTLDAALATAHTDAYERAKQALLATESWNGDVDEDAVIRILRGIQGEVRLERGETVESIGADEAARRRRDSATRIRLDLREDPDLRDIFAAMGEWSWDGSEVDMLNAVTSGDAFETARLELVEAYEGIDTDETAILRILRDTTADVRARLLDEHPDPIGRIRTWAGPESESAFRRAFETTLETGRIPMEDALDEAFGEGLDDFAGTNVELVNEVLGNLSTEDRATMRRGYLLAHALLDGGAGERVLTSEDRAAITRYQLLRMRLRSELSDEDLDTAIGHMIGLPSVEEMRSEDCTGRIDAAAIMLYRQRERLEMGAGITDAFTTTDDTAESAHVEFESRYHQALADGNLTVEEFAVLVNLDTQFNDRFREYSATANMVSEIAGTVAAVVAAAIVIIGTGGAAAAPTIGAWLSANAGLVGGAAAAGAISQVVVSEATGGSFHEAMGADGARGALSGALNGALAVCGAALAEHAATLVGLTGESLTAAIARAAAESVEVSVMGRAFARGALTGLIDGALGGAIGELAMTLTDAQTWRQSVWGVLARAGAALLHGGLLGGITGAGMGGLMEMASTALARRAITGVHVEMDLPGSRIEINYEVTTEGALEGLALRFGPETTDADIAAHVDRIVAIRNASSFLRRARAALTGLEDAPVGTVSGDAAHEAAKVPDMIQDRLRRLAGELGPGERDVIEAEIDVLQSNFDHFSAVAASGDMSPGSGTIARFDRPTPEFPPCPDGHYYRRRGDGWDLQKRPEYDDSIEPLTIERIPPDEITGPERWRTVRRSEVSDTPAVRAVVTETGEHEVSAATRAEMDTLAENRLGFIEARDEAEREIAELVEALGISPEDARSRNIERTIARLRAEHAGDADTLARIEELARQRGLLSAAHRDLTQTSELLGNRAAMDIMEESGYTRLWGNPTPPGRPGEFDFIYVRRNSNGDITEIYVVEAKGATSGLGSAEHGGVRVEQGTPQYLDGTARGMMRDDGSELDDVLDRIINRSGPGADVSYIKVQAPVDPTTGEVLEPVVSRFRI